MSIFRQPSGRRRGSADIQEDRCVICGATQASVDNLTDAALLVNAIEGCGHKFCKRCKESKLARQMQFPCPHPGCGRVVRASTLSARSAEEAEADRDAERRRRVKAIYNKVPEMFASQREYNDYEEMVEDIIFNLVHGVDEEGTWARVAAYEQQHKAEIAAEQTRRAEAAAREAEALQRERSDLDRARTLLQENDQRERLAKRDLIHQTNQVMLGDRDSVDRSSAQGAGPGVLSRMMMGSAAPTATATASTSAATAAGAPVMTHVTRFFMQRDEPRAIFREMPSGGPVLSDPAALQAAHRAGGFSPDTAFHRNIAEALQCLRIAPPTAALASSS